MAKKLKVPKRIAGVKIPKVIRKGPVGDFLNSSVGQVLVAEAVLAAGGALAAGRTDPHSQAGKALRHPFSQLKRATRAAMHERGSATDTLAASRERLAFALSEAVAAFRAALSAERAEGAEPRADELEPDEEHPSAAVDAGTQDGKKKPSGLRARPQTPH
jgi:hypothetical protein